MSTIRSRKNRKKKYTLSDYVYHKLLSKISSGDYKPHSKLPPESDLSKTFDVSRPIVRVALDQLRKDGLIYSRQGSGSYVKVNANQPVPGFAPISTIADIQRGYEFRISIERDAAFYAAQRANTALINEIGSALERQAKAALSNEFYIEADLDFHLAIAKATNNFFYTQVLISMADHITVGMKIGGTALVGPNPTLGKVIEEHEAIFNAIRNRDPEKAKKAMRHHIESARNRVFENKFLDLSLT